MVGIRKRKGVLPSKFEPNRLFGPTDASRAADSLNIDATVQGILRNMKSRGLLK